MTAARSGVVAGLTLFAIVALDVAGMPVGPRGGRLAFAHDFAKVTFVWLPIRLFALMGSSALLIAVGCSSNESNGGPGGTGGGSATGGVGGASGASTGGSSGLGATGGTATGGGAGVGNGGGGVSGTGGNPSGGGANADIFSWSFEDGTLGDLGDPAVISGGLMDPDSTDHAVAGESWCASYTDTESASNDTGAGMKWPPSWGTTSQSDVWVRVALKWEGGNAKSFQKVLRFYDQSDSFIGNFGTSGSSFIWDFGNLDDPGQVQPNVGNLPPLGEWHWYELHLQFPVNAKATVAIYQDGNATPLWSGTSAYANAGSVLREYQFFGTVNVVPPGAGYPPPGTFEFKLDAVAISSQRVGLPAGAVIGP